MSDPVVQRYDNKEDTQLLLSNVNVRESCYQYQSQGMAHWMRVGSSSTSSKCCTTSDAQYQENIVKEQGYLPLETTKSIEAKILSTDMNQVKTSANKGVHRAEPNELNVISDVHQTTESVRAENRQCKIMNNSVVQKKMKLLDAKAAVSDTLSVHKLPDSSVEWEKFNTYRIMNSENGSSELNHFPMFDINCKMESILNPKKKSAHGALAGGLSEPQILLNETNLAPHVIEIASEDQQLKMERMTQKNQDIESCQDEFTGSISHSAIERLKLFGSDMRPCDLTKGESDPSSLENVFKEHSLNATVTGLEHVFCNISTNAAFMMLGMKGDDKIIARDFKRSWSRVSSGSAQIPRDSCPGNFPLQLLTSEPNEELLDVSTQKSFLGLNKLDDIGYLHHVSHQMPICSNHDMETLRVQTTLNSVNKRIGECQKLFDSAENLLITKKMGTDLSHGKLMIEKSMDSAKIKGSPFFQMLELPSISQYIGIQCDDLQPLVKSSNIGDSEDGIGMYTLETQNEPSFKTDTMFIRVDQVPSSPAGETSSRVQEGVVCPNLSKSESTTASPVKHDGNEDAETELCYMNVEHPTSLEREACMTNREMSTSRTESMDADHILSHVEKPNNSNTRTLLESSVCADASSRWVKRLRHNCSDSRALDSKRLKIGDGRSSREVGTLFGRVLNYSKPSSDFVKCLQEQQKHDKTMLLPHNGVHSSGVSVKEMHFWIRRWCCNSPQAAPVQAKLATPVLCEPENSKVVPQNFDGKQLPSIAAMALMGKAINNFQPCEFQRRGSSVVWRTEGF
uniref:Uncharacterized protein LOC105047180 n=1 Tax=Elaeis guineensis var. tenera TaxID=51953 RepID=A0A6I9RCG0_ELAGV|nr:uncharacterized protein LOC105047180 [Elaeis guineensis]XP_010924293.1 uncharacterized protein LOC105047180 [Elaeis guineensis]XP_019706963.1 uncharacterized protein LOC105047180 [Elaeis guineensis]XP_019706964.1 uncharacterized protein LOC105047180 [Elaeis guineensis]